MCVGGRGNVESLLILWYSFVSEASIFFTAFPVPLYLFTTKLPIIPPLHVASIIHQSDAFLIFFISDHTYVPVFPFSSLIVIVLIHRHWPRSNISVTQCQTFSFKDNAISVSYYKDSVTQSISQIIFLFLYLEKGYRVGYIDFGCFPPYVDWSF